MPTKKQATKVDAPKVKKASCAKMTMPKKKMPMVNEANAAVVCPPPSVCRACNAMPIGSTEMFGVMVIVIVSLSAVLLTSVYALEMQQQKINTLENQIQVSI